MPPLHDSQIENSSLATPAVAEVSSHISPWLAPLVYPLGRYCLMPTYFQRIQVLGREHLAIDGPMILAPTHRSRWDAFMVPYAAGQDITGRHLHFMVSLNETKGLQGWFVRQLGGYAINPNRPTIASLRHTLELIQQQQVIVIFPEGGDYVGLGDDPQHRVYDLKPGLARLALQAASSQAGSTLKIVPMSILYSAPVPHWRSSAQIRIGRPLEVASYQSCSLKQSAQTLTVDLESSLRSLHCPCPEQSSHNTSPPV
jgi:1-acyl-sn-glycerol-3-phosphate acyltransferase